jgi:hypothetical protein
MHLSRRCAFGSRSFTGHDLFGQRSINFKSRVKGEDGPVQAQKTIGGKLRTCRDSDCVKGAEGGKDRASGLAGLDRRRGRNGVRRTP